MRQTNPVNRIDYNFVCTLQQFQNLFKVNLKDIPTSILVVSRYFKIVYCQRRKIFVTQIRPVSLCPTNSLIVRKYSNDPIFKNCNQLKKAVTSKNCKLCNQFLIKLLN